LDLESGLPVHTWTPVVTRRRVLAGRDLDQADWTYAYDSPGPQETTVTYPDGRTSTYRYGGIVGQADRPALSPEWGLVERTLRAGSSVLEREELEYQELPVGDPGEVTAIGHAGVLKKRTLERGGITFTTEHSYASSDY